MLLLSFQKNCVALYVIMVPREVFGEGGVLLTLVKGVFNGRKEGGWLSDLPASTYLRRWKPHRG